MSQNKVKGILLGTSHYTTKDTEFLPKGTLMFHYAIVGGDTQGIEDYETAKGSFLRKVEDAKSPYFEKPMHFTSQIPTVDEGEEVEFTVSEKGQLSVFETLAERTVKAKAKKAEYALTKGLNPEIVQKMKLASMLGLNVSI